MAKSAPKPKDTEVATISPANLVRTTIRIVGESPFVQCAFSQKVKEKLMRDMATPKNERKARTARPPRNYDEDFEGAQHKAVGGWNGIPAMAFKAAMIDACRTVGLVMTTTKLALKIIAEGFDASDGTPLVRLQSATPPERGSHPVRNENGSVDIRVRPMWRTWYADVTVEFDADMITAESIVNLLDRAGRQVGVGEGRSFSKKSVGMGWGFFRVETREENVA